MKNTLFIFIIFFGLKIHAQNQEVQKTIENFFVAFHAKDTIKLKAICSEKMILQSISDTKFGAKLSDESPLDFFKSIASIPDGFDFQEKILSFSIQVDGQMATVWTPYEFYMNGKLSHSGVNSFTLFKENQEWKIIYCIDTRRK